MSKYVTAPSCESSCPCRTVQTDPTCACGFTKCQRENPYCEVTRLAERAVVSSKAEGGPGLSESDALLQAFDKMAQFHREEAKRRAEGDGSIEGGVVGVKAQTPLHVHAGAERPGLPIPAPRCIANIPTTKKKVAHQCRNRAKYGEHCALHATGKTTEDLEQYPAALAEPAADPFQW